MAPFLLGIPRKRIFFTVLDTRLCFGQFFNKRENMLNGTSSRLRPLGPWWALHGCRRRNEWLSHGSSTEADNCAAP